MRNLLFTQLHIGIGQRSMGMALCKGGLRPGMPRFIEHPRSGTEAHDLAHLLKSLPARSGFFRPRFASITIADSLVRLFMVTPPPNAAGRADLEAAAAIRFQTLYGGPPSQWTIQAPWHPGRAFLACALPAALHAVLLQGMAEHNLVLMEIAPRFVAVWNRWRRHIRLDTWFVVIEEDHLTLAILSGYNVTALRATRLPQPLYNLAHWLTAHLQCEALVLGFPLPALVQFCGYLVEALPEKCDGMVFQRLGMRAPFAAPRADGPGIELALSGAP